MSRECRVTFFQIKSDGEKRERIIRLAEEYFEKKEPLLIRLPHDIGDIWRKLIFYTKKGIIGESLICPFCC